MTTGSDDNPFQAPESRTSFTDYELPEQMELYPICVITGSFEDLRQVTQSIECGPWPIKVIRRCANLTVFLFLGQTLTSAAVAPLKAMRWFLMIAAGAAVVSLVCTGLWRALRDRTTITFFVTEEIWRKQKRQIRDWGLGIFGLIAALTLLAVYLPPNTSASRNVVHTMAPSLLLLALYVCIENAFQKFSIPSLIRHQGQPMLQVSRVYQEMAHRVGEIAETKPEEELASATSDSSRDE